MCNRYRLSADQVKVARAMGVPERFIIPEHDPLPSPELFPKRLSWIVRNESGERVLDVKSWGIPNRMPGKRPGTFVVNWVTNVRNLKSPFWRSTLANPANRCLVPFTHFAEPKPGKDEEGRPANWWFNLPGSEIAAFAGIWRPYTVETKEGPVSGQAFAFLTCEPNALVAPLHSKAMPVILHPEDYDRWLDGETDDACSLAAPFPSQLMTLI